MGIIEIIGLIVAVLASLGAIIGIPWHFRGRFANIESKMNEVIRTNNTLAELSGSLVELLLKNKVLRDEDSKEITKVLVRSLNVKEISPNPITREDRERLNDYIRKAQQGGNFTAEEVEDYDDIVSELQHERPDDPNIWPLVSFRSIPSWLVFRD